MNPWDTPAPTLLCQSKFIYSCKGSEKQTFFNHCFKPGQRYYPQFQLIHTLNTKSPFLHYPWQPQMLLSVPYLLYTSTLLPLTALTLHDPLPATQPASDDPLSSAKPAWDGSLLTSHHACDNSLPTTEPACKYSLPVAQPDLLRRLSNHLLMCPTLPSSHCCHLTCMGCLSGLRFF